MADLSVGNLANQHAGILQDYPREGKRTSAKWKAGKWSRKFALAP
jgi:hypothetical protein